MLRILDPRASLSASLIRCLGLAAVATLALLAGTARRAEALSLINPATSTAAKAASDGMITAVRHGGGGHGFHGGGHFGGYHGGHVGAFRAAPMYRAHVGGYRYGGYRHYGGYRYAGYPRFYRHHFHRRYYGGYYPYYSYPRYHRCRVIWTYYGPRRVCRWHHWHRWGYLYRYW